MCIMIKSFKLKEASKRKKLQTEIYFAATKMWRQDGRSVFWTDAAKLKLVDLMKRNSGALNSDRLSPEKTYAWKKIYDGLIKAGMPKTSIERVKKCWSRIQLAAKAQHTEQLKKYSKHGKLVPLSKLDQTIINFLNDVNSDNILKVSFNKCYLVLSHQSIFLCILYTYSP